MSYQLKRLVERVVNAMTAWQSWTPSLTQSGAVAATVTRARYRRVGNRVDLDVDLAVTAAGTGAQIISIGNLPVAIVGASAWKATGAALIVDTGTGLYNATVVAYSATTLYFSATGAGNNYVGQAPNFALANGDFISFQASYEIA